jgi:hypothetical protein
MTIDRKRRDGVIDPFEIVAVDILLSAERPLVERPLRALIGDRALGAIERRSVGVALQKVLADLRSDLFQAEADIGEDRIVPPQAVLGLQNVPDADRAHRGAEGEEDNEHLGISNTEYNEQSEYERARKTCHDRHVSHRPPPQFLWKINSETRMPAEGRNPLICYAMALRRPQKAYVRPVTAGCHLMSAARRSEAVLFWAWPAGGWGKLRFSSSCHQNEIHHF